MSSFPAGLNTTASLHTEKETIYVTNFTCPFRRATFHFGEERFSKTCRQQQRTVIDKGGNRKEARAERKNFVDGYSVLPVVVDDVSHSLCAITPRCNHYLSSTVRFAPTFCNTHHTFIHFRMETRLIVPQKNQPKLQILAPLLLVTKTSGESKSKKNVFYSQGFTLSLSLTRPGRTGMQNGTFVV